MKFCTSNISPTSFSEPLFINCLPCHSSLKRSLLFLVLSSAEDRVLLQTRNLINTLVHFFVTNDLPWFSGALRLFRRVVQLKDEFYNRHIVRSKAFEVSTDENFDLYSEFIESERCVKLLRRQAQYCMLGIDCGVKQKPFYGRALGRSCISVAKPY